MSVKYLSITGMSTTGLSIAVSYGTHQDVGDDDNDIKEQQQLDPRIQVELERMNGATEEINKLEKELDEARGRFRVTLSESSSKLNVLLKKHKRSIEKSRAYYQHLELAKQTQCETQKAAVQFRRASSFYKAAKETITLAEQRLTDKGVQFDEAWQEMLNHSTIKMMDAEKEKMRSELEHHGKSQAYQELESKVHRFEKGNRKSIATAKPYYELKANLELQLQQQKQNVNDLQKAVSEAKSNYKMAMCSLEKISEEIHEQRKLPLPPREPGVGCESDEDFPSEINLEKHLNFDVSDDGISTDAESLCSYDSGPMSHLPYQDGISISSSGYDSAICSPKSLTLDRSEEQLTLQILSLGNGEHLSLRNGTGSAPSSPDSSVLESQTSRDTIVYESDSESEDEQPTRLRSSTLQAS